MYVLYVCVCVRACVCVHARVCVCVCSYVCTLAVTRRVTCPSLSSDSVLCPRTTEKGDFRRETVYYPYN